MAEYIIQETTLKNIADAIRIKTGNSNQLSPSQMVSEISSISTSQNGDSSESNIFYMSEQTTVNEPSQGTFVTLISNNSEIATNWNNQNLFVAVSPNSLEAIDSSVYSGCYQWTFMMASNKQLTFSDSESDIWYGVGTYLMTGKSYAYPSTLEVPYNLNNASNTNYSYLNVTENGDVRIYICGYDVLAAGQYTVTVGLL